MPTMIYSIESNIYFFPSLSLPDKSRRWTAARNLPAVHGPVFDGGQVPPEMCTDATAPAGLCPGDIRPPDGQTSEASAKSPKE